MGAISHRLGASSGSIYHRFPSRNALLGRLWMQKAAQFAGRCTAAPRDTRIRCMDGSAGPGGSEAED
ncbi:MAG: TetR family transcriptional regulator [Bradyrhizobium sp.]|uniref:TetR family transcriptional regulator n=1 Tax=Bradyrhizobium sp. TaxID=376 RepID=UPI001203B2EB|nr:MAG: TetR family transcriptional regulator [Bradyrhizobium sp.]